MPWNKYFLNDRLRTSGWRWRRTRRAFRWTKIGSGSWKSWRRSWGSSCESRSWSTTPWRGRTCRFSKKSANWRKQKTTADLMHKGYYWKIISRDKNSTFIFESGLKRRKMKCRKSKIIHILGLFWEMTNMKYLFCFVNRKIEYNFTNYKVL